MESRIKNPISKERWEIAQIGEKEFRIQEDIDSSRYLTLARLDKNGNILEEYYGQSKHYLHSGNKN